MPTQNRRIAAYIPSQIENAFRDFKSKRQIKGDSEALIVILSEYLQVSQEVAHPSSLNLLQRIEAIENQLGNLSSKLLSELKLEIERKIDNLSQRVQEVQLSQQTLTTVELARRLNMPDSSLSHWKSDDPKRGKSPQAFLEATRAKDPEGIGWILLKEINRFKPERPINSSKSGIQGELLRVNPVAAQRSERSEEG